MTVFHAVHQHLHLSKFGRCLPDEFLFCCWHCGFLNVELAHDTQQFNEVGLYKLEEFLVDGLKYGFDFRVVDSLGQADLVGVSVLDSA